MFLLIKQLPQNKLTSFYFNNTNLEFVDDEELDDDSYAILNKELRKQILIFERQILKAEQVFMDIGDLLDFANELIDHENIKKNATNQGVYYRAQDLRDIIMIIVVLEPLDQTMMVLHTIITIMVTILLEKMFIMVIP